MHGGKRSFQVVLVYKRGPSGWPSRVARRVSISRERRVRRSFVRSFPRLSFHPSPRIDAIRMIPSLRGVTERVRARFSKKLVGWNPVRKRERDEEEGIAARGKEIGSFRSTPSPTLLPPPCVSQPSSSVSNFTALPDTTRFYLPAIDAMQTRAAMRVLVSRPSESLSIEFLFVSFFLSPSFFFLFAPPRRREEETRRWSLDG